MKSLILISSLALIASLGLSCDAKSDKAPAAPAAKAAPVTVKVETASTGTVAGQAFKSLPELQALVAKLDKKQVIRLSAAPEMAFTDLEPVMRLLKKQPFPSILLSISKVEVELISPMGNGQVLGLLPPTCDLYVVADGYNSRGQDFQSLNDLKPDLEHYAEKSKEVIVNVTAMPKASVKHTAELLDCLAAYKFSKINIFPDGQDQHLMPPPPPPPPPDVPLEIAPQ